jgi:hypothetical protein
MYNYTQATTTSRCWLWRRVGLRPLLLLLCSQVSKLACVASRLVPAVRALWEQEERAHVRGTLSVVCAMCIRCTHGLHSLVLAAFVVHALVLALHSTPSSPHPPPSPPHSQPVHQASARRCFDPPWWTAPSLEAEGSALLPSPNIRWLASQVRLWRGEEKCGRGVDDAGWFCSFLRKHRRRSLFSYVNGGVNGRLPSLLSHLLCFS